MFENIVLFDIAPEHLGEQIPSNGPFPSAGTTATMYGGCGSGCKRHWKCHYGEIWFSIQALVQGSKKT